MSNEKENMNCTDIQALLDDYLDNELVADKQNAVELHINNCVSCQQSLQEIQAIRQALRSLPVPDSSPDFEARVFAEVRKHHTGHFGNRFTMGFASATAAALALWFASTIFSPQLDENQLQIIKVAMNQTLTVRLMFEAPADLDQVTLSVGLPKNIELEGYAGQKQLVWQTSLKKGENILALPVTAIGGGQGELVAKLSYGDQLKQFRIVLKTANDGALNYQIHQLKSV